MRDLSPPVPPPVLPLKYGVLLLEPAGVEAALLPLALEDVIYDSDVPGCSGDLNSVRVDGEDMFVVAGESSDDAFG